VRPTGVGEPAGAAAVAALLLGNSIGAVKKTLGEIAKAFSGPKWKTSDYRDLLCLLFLLTKTMKMKGMIALEQSIKRRMPGNGRLGS